MPGYAATHKYPWSSSNTVRMKLWLKLPGSLGVVLVDDERVAIVAVEALSRAKPHEPPAILQNGDDIVLGQAIFGGEVAEFEVARQRVAVLPRAG